MLIRSCRHTAADLELWVALERADKEHAKRIDKKIAKAKERLLAFSRQGGFYVNISWGKDSVVLAHLCWVLREEIGMPWWFHRSLRPSFVVEEIDQVAAAFFSRFSYPLYMKLEMWSDDSSMLRAACQQLADTDRYATGVRADESGPRKISGRYHGAMTYRACRPLIDWSAQDVFAYLARYDLPVHPWYAMLGGGRWDRDRIRVERLGGDEGTEFGRREWEQEYYGDVLRRIEAGCYLHSSG